MPKRMDRFWRLSAWISRAALAFAIFDFGVPALASSLEPVMMAWNKGIGTWTSSAITTTRVQFAAYPIVVILVSIYCLLAPRRMLAGLGLISAISTMALIGYSVGLWVDGVANRGILLVERQALASIIYGFAFVIEWQRRLRERGQITELA
jgi:hypothetical protein